MYKCETLGCPEYVSHPGQFCLGCRQRNEATEDDFEMDDETGEYL